MWVELPQELKPGVIGGKSEKRLWDQDSGA